jgi:hypothetical protein
MVTGLMLLHALVPQRLDLGPLCLGQISTGGQSMIDRFGIQRAVGRHRRRCEKGKAGESRKACADHWMSLCASNFPEAIGLCGYPLSVALVGGAMHGAF